jgi:hypothetical protein
MQHEIPDLFSLLIMMIMKKMTKVKSQFNKTENETDLPIRLFLIFLFGIFFRKRGVAIYLII